MKPSNAELDNSIPHKALIKASNSGFLSLNRFYFEPDVVDDCELHPMPEHVKTKGIKSGFKKNVEHWIEIAEIVRPDHLPFDNIELRLVLKDTFFRIYLSNTLFRVFGTSAEHDRPFSAFGFFRDQAIGRPATVIATQRSLPIDEQRQTASVIYTMLKLCMSLIDKLNNRKIVDVTLEAQPTDMTHLISHKTTVDSTPKKMGSSTININMVRLRYKHPDGKPANERQALTPHYRRGHYRTYKNGKRVWVEPSAVLGGGNSPKPYRIKP